MADPRRFFVITGHTASLSPTFSLNDLPGSAGRLDILARCVTNAFCLSHGLRHEVETLLLLQDQVLIRFDGARLKRLNPDERSTAALIRHALIALEEGRSRSTPGVSVERADLAGVVEELHGRGCQLRLLDEAGSEIREASLPEPIAFFLSDHRNFTPEEAGILHPLKPLSLGPRILQADQAIVLVHNELDRRAGALV